VVRCVQPIACQPLRFALVFLLGVLALSGAIVLMAGLTVTDPLQASNDTLFDTRLEIQTQPLGTHTS
jgi:hypothetical protein